MSATPEISVIVTTFQRPESLKRVLLSLSAQVRVQGQMEVVVADDGSSDETPEVVAQFAASVGFPLKFVTHPHDGFRLAASRNEGFDASSAPYVVFLDGDCVLPPDHVAIQLQRRQPGVVRVGDCCYLDAESSRRITEEVIRTGEYERWVPPTELRRLAIADVKARFYSLLRHPRKPKLKGGNVGLWRQDFERVNGYDESYRGWGCEDDDFGMRLRRAGLRLKSILHWTRCYHLWHPLDPSAPTKWRDGLNVQYFQRRRRLTCCRNGLKKRQAEELKFRVIGPAESLPSRILSSQVSHREKPEQSAEVEVLLFPGTGRFSGRADYHVLVLLEDAPADLHLVQDADVVIGRRAGRLLEGQRHFPLDQIDEALRSVA